MLPVKVLVGGVQWLVRAMVKLAEGNKAEAFLRILRHFHNKNYDRDYAQETNAIFHMGRHPMSWSFSDVQCIYATQRGTHMDPCVQL